MLVRLAQPVADVLERGEILAGDVLSHVGAHKPIFAAPVFPAPFIVAFDQPFDVIVQRHERAQQFGVGRAIHPGVFQRRARVGGEALRRNGDPAMTRQLLLHHVLLGENLVAFLGGDAFVFALDDGLLQQPAVALLDGQINLHAAQFDVLLYFPAEQAIERGDFVFKTFAFGVTAPPAFSLVELAQRAVEHFVIILVARKLVLGHIERLVQLAQAQLEIVVIAEVYANQAEQQRRNLTVGAPRGDQTALAGQRVGMQLAEGFGVSPQFVIGKIAGRPHSGHLARLF